MKSWRAEQFGDPADVLKLEEIDIPDVVAKHLLVKVLAAGVGLPDVLMLKGAYPLVPNPPVSPGQELVAEVVAVPEGSSFAVDDRVMGMSRFDIGLGAFSEYCLMPQRKACAVPAELSNEQAAGFMIPYLTAYAALVVRTHLQAGETLLVLGGAGSSGSAAIQLGKYLGATVIAVASSPEKLDFCREQGADHVLSYRECDIVNEVNALTGNRGVNVVFDPVGGKTGEQTINCIARYGRIALIGFASGDWPGFSPVDLVLKNVSAVGVFAGGISGAETRRSYEALCRLAVEGKLTTPITRVFGFDEVPEALHTIGHNPPSGKLIVKMTGRKTK